MDSQTIAMPKDAKIITVQLQDGKPCIWAMVNPDQPKVKKTILCYDTGQAIPHPNKLTYIGTCQADAGDIVYHVFEQSVP